MGIDYDSSHCQDPNSGAPKETTEKKYGSYSWHLRTPDGVILAKAIKPQALINTARAIYDIGEVKNGLGKLMFLYGVDGKLIATVSTRTGLLKNVGLQDEKHLEGKTRRSKKSGSIRSRTRTRTQRA